MTVVEMNERIDVIRHVEKLHMFSSAGVKTGSREEHWRCKCGAGYTGDGAIERGHRHQAQEIVLALDEAVSR